MPLLSYCELGDGRRILLMAVSAKDRERLNESLGVWTDIPPASRAQLGLEGVQMVGLVPCEPEAFVDLVLALESSALRLEKVTPPKGH
jgi:hypothetical protein